MATPRSKVKSHEKMLSWPNVELGKRLFRAADCKNSQACQTLQKLQGSGHLLCKLHDSAFRGERWLQRPARESG